MIHDPVLTTQGGVTLIGGGAVAGADLAQALARAPVLVAADGGADRALVLGHTPRAVIGDFDSISDAARTTLAGRLHPVAEQDSTDFEKCLQRIRADFLVAVGFAGGRLDHALAALSVMVRRPERVVMLTAEEVVFRAPARLALDLPTGTRVSLYPMGPVSGRSDGLRWPIDGLVLSPAGRVGTSNAALGPVRLAVTGPLLVMLPRACLDTAIGAICA